MTTPPSTPQTTPITAPEAPQPRMQDRAAALFASFSPTHAMRPAQEGAVNATSVWQVDANQAIRTPPADDIFKRYQSPEEHAKKHGGKEWWESPQGRVGTRIFSRGVMGSLFYALASIAAEKALANYDPAAHIADAERYANANGLVHKFIRGLAQLTDKTIAPAIRKTVSLFTSDPLVIRSATTFRPNRTWGEAGVYGRSLGHEAMDVTFNFAAASFGDALGRNFAQVIDPNKEISWMKDGKFDAEQFAVSQAKALWKILTYNSGEDFAAALPYVYSMKLQRGLINRTSWGRGFDHVFDHGNAAAYKVNDGGQVAGNYYWQNMLDYQLRFTHYNILTLMYREIYNSVGNRLNDWIDKGEMPSMRLPKTLGEAANYALDSAQDIVAYVGRSILKGYVLMTPTVPFFSFFRLPQAHSRAMAIHPEYGAMMIDGAHTESGQDAYLTPAFRSILKPDLKNTDGTTIYRHNPSTDSFTATDQTLGMKFSSPYASHLAPHNPMTTPIDDVRGITRFNPYKKPPMNNGIFYRVSNKTGEMAFNASRKVYNVLVDLRYMTGSKTEARGQTYNRELQRMTLDHLNSALSYTPYFAAKTEFAELWDNTKTDKALDRVVRGMARLNGREFMAGVADTVDALVHPGTESGLGSVYGNDTAHAGGWMPWSRAREADVATGSNATIKQLAETAARNAATTGGYAAQVGRKQSETRATPSSRWTERKETVGTPAAHVLH